MKMILIAACLLVSGCTATLPQETRVTIPVECREEVPDRPVMPTDAIQSGAGLDVFVQAATAEIERREGYEVRLRSALVSCTKPLENVSSMASK